MQTLHSTLNTRHLTIHTDGGSRGNPGPAATGIVILDESEKLVHEFGNYLGAATNNDAEYTAVIDALAWIIAPHSTPHIQLVTLNFKLDSKLVVEQLSGRWKINNQNLLNLKSRIMNLISQNSLQVTFEYIPRAQNAAADREVNIGLDSKIIILNLESYVVVPSV